MTNFLRGMGSIFNLFPETDYMAMVPREGEMLRQAEVKVARYRSNAYKKVNSYYGVPDKSEKRISVEEK